MKVLIVHPEFYTYGGAERLVVKLCNYLTSKNVQNTLLTYSILPNILNDLKETRYLCAKEYSRKGTMQGLRPVIQEIARDFDVVNSHNHPAELLLHPLNIPHVWMFNEPPNYILEGEHKIKSNEIEIVRDNVNKVCVADDYNQRKVRELYGIDSIINPYGIDSDYFSQRGNTGRIREKYNLGDSFVTLQVGFITPTKNQLRSIKILEALKNQIPDVKLLLVGYNKLPYANDVWGRVKAKGLERDVIMTGEVSQEELRDIYWASDVVIQPIHSQGGYLSTFEAMCANKLVIVSKEITVADTLSKENIGIVTDNFEETILDYHNNRSKYQDRIERGARWVKGNLSWDKFGGVMLKTFEEVAL